jgi:hypothetical protein
MLHRRSPAVPIGTGLDHDHLQLSPAPPASSS